MHETPTRKLRAALDRFDAESARTALTSNERDAFERHMRIVTDYIDRLSDSLRTRFIAGATEEG